MSIARRRLCFVYYALAVVALVATWRQNLAFGSELGVGPVELFRQFWPALFANRATTSITLDLFLLMLAGVIWMVLEARRLRIRGAWLYVVFAILIAISVTFPLFLAARERRLAEVEASSTEPSPAPSDMVGLAIMIVSTLGIVVFWTLR